MKTIDFKYPVQRARPQFLALKAFGKAEFFLFACWLLTMCRIAGAQTKPDINGDWNGIVNSGGRSLRMALHVRQERNGDLTVSLDSLDQGITGLPGTGVLNGSDFSFQIPSANASYKGTVSQDGREIAGALSQGSPMSLNFSRGPGLGAASGMLPAVPPVSLDNLKHVLDREFAPVAKDGLLSEASGGGLVIGILDHGERRIFTYGRARPNSIFEIGSITKTLTGLVLAQMVVEKKVTLNEPIRELLPTGTVGKPAGPEITLLDLATHRSGLAPFPANLSPRNPLDPFADYDETHLNEFLGRHGVAEPPSPQYAYSSLGFGVLAYGLSRRSGVPFVALVSSEVTTPLHMDDTVAVLTSAQRERLIQGYDPKFDPVGAWEFGALAGAGCLKSTAADMLTYLDASLHPKKYARESPDSSGRTLRDAMVIDHEPRGAAIGGLKTALAWTIDRSHTYFHNGDTGGYDSRAEFNPQDDRAIVVLYNRRSEPPAEFVIRVSENVNELMSGKPAVRLDLMSDSERLALSEKASKH